MGEEPRVLHVKIKQGEDVSTHQIEVHPETTVLDMKQRV
jgi:hypothetical protein